MKTTIKPTIVCVDDEKAVLLSLRDLLICNFQDDYNIEIAQNGLEALTLLDELHADGIDIPLVISDHIMPGLKGDELLIKVHSRYPKTLNVLLTGQANADAVGNTVNHANLYRYISKPWNDIDLCLTVTEALRRYQQAKELERLKQEQTRLIAILEVSPDCIAITDLEGHLLWVNSQLRQLRNLPLDTDLSQLLFFDFHDRASKEILLDRGIPIAIEQGLWAGETTLLSSQGTEIPVSQLIIAHRSEDGNVEYLSTIARDVSEIRDMNAELNELRTSVNDDLGG
ncbi:response regulator [Tumidithrix elongata RA019]|uniref:Response regulator n=1 Tax=Tumidithrix elongata BACA0141 TaxID=2716417 RepID=A0AAW9Q0J0_9CYAN|nr:response regulator [Tumidithrix elongata RA019]